LSLLGIALGGEKRECYTKRKRGEGSQKKEGIAYQRKKEKTENLTLGPEF